MDAITKLLRNMSRKDKERVLAALIEIQAGTLSGSKLQGTDAYRVRVGNFRIIYHLDSATPVIDAVRRRNEQTYS